MTRMAIGFGEIADPSTRQTRIPPALTGLTPEAGSEADERAGLFTRADARLKISAVQP